MSWCYQEYRLHSLYKERLALIKAIGFDGNGVLYYRRDDFTDALMRYIKEKYLPDFDLNRGAELQLKLMGEAFDGGISKKVALTSFLDRVGLQDPTIQADVIQKELEFSRAISLFPGERETLIELERRGFRLGMITNSYQSAAEKASWFRNLGLECIAGTIVSSIDAGVSKPEPGIYLEFVRVVGFVPEEIAFVGHEKSELEGAAKVGMTPISFNCGPDIRRKIHLEKFSDLLKLSLSDFSLK